MGTIAPEADFALSPRSPSFRQKDPPCRKFPTIDFHRPSRTVTVQREVVEMSWMDRQAAKQDPIVVATCLGNGQPFQVANDKAPFALGK